MATTSCRAYWVEDDDGRDRVQCNFSLKDDVTQVGGNGSPEAEDYKRECRASTILTSHKLFHSTDFTLLVGRQGRDPTLMRPSFMFWWLGQYVGQRLYGGGWFMFNQTRSSVVPILVIEFSSLQDIDVLHFGEEWRRRWDAVCFDYYLPMQYLAYEYVQFARNKKYTPADFRSAMESLVDQAMHSDSVSPFDKDEVRSMAFRLGQVVDTPDRGTQSHPGKYCFKIMGDFFPEPFGASHLVKGPRNWHQKLYPMLIHSDELGYADDLGRRMSHLGFNGYSSCDECEVFLSHKTQANIVPTSWVVDSTMPSDHPVRIAYELTNDAWQTLSLSQKFTFLKNRKVSTLDKRFYVGDFMYTTSAEQWVREAQDLFPFVSDWSRFEEVF